MLKLRRVCVPVFNSPIAIAGHHVCHQLLQLFGRDIKAALAQQFAQRLPQQRFGLIALQILNKIFIQAGKIRLRVTGGIFGIPRQQSIGQRLQLLGRCIDLNAIHQAREVQLQPGKVQISHCRAVQLQVGKVKQAGHCLFQAAGVHRKSVFQRSLIHAEHLFQAKPALFALLAEGVPCEYVDIGLFNLLAHNFAFGRLAHHVLR